MNKTDDNIITFDHETKYTATVREQYKIEGLDEDPPRYEVVPWVSTRARKRGSKDITFDDLEGAEAPASIRVRRYFRENPDATNEEVARDLAIGKRTVTRYKPKT